VILERPGATIRWLMMWAQWPYTSLRMLERYDELLDGWGDSIPSDAPAGDPMLHLLGEVQASLDVATRDRLDDELSGLRGLLGVADAALSWEEIRRVRRYTVNFNPAVEEQPRELVVQAPPAAPDP
jgi:hypothetical protein